MTNDQLIEEIQRLRKKAQMSYLWELNQMKDNFVTGDVKVRSIEDLIEDDWISYVPEKYFKLVEEADRRRLKYDY